MTATQHQAGQKLDCSVKCNAESASESPSTETVFFPASEVLGILGKARESVLTLRTQLGLHRVEKERGRWERWEITAAKLMVIEDLTLALSSTGRLNLTVEKPSLSAILSDLDSFRESVFQLRGYLAGLPLSDALDTAWHRADDILNSVEFLIYSLLGSAEEQPLNREKKTPESAGSPPATVPASDLAPPSPVAVPFDLMPSNYSTPEIEALSEWCLDELERRGAVVHWSLTGA